MACDFDDPQYWRDRAEQVRALALWDQQWKG